MKVQQRSACGINARTLIRRYPVQLQHRALRDIFSEGVIVRLPMAVWSNQNLLWRSVTRQACPPVQYLPVQPLRSIDEAIHNSGATAGMVRCGLVSQTRYWRIGEDWSGLGDARANQGRILVEPGRGR